MKDTALMPRLALSLWIVALVGGCVLEDKPVDPDGGLGGVGGSGPCGTCTGDAPACDEETNTCVQCTPEDSIACTDDTPACNPETFRCVACVASTDCDDASMARCDTEDNECVPCTSEADCAHLLDVPVCSDGDCVQCTPANEARDCSGNSCDPATLTCTETMIGSRQTCETCVSDTECAQEGNRCVAMVYQGEPYPDTTTGFCLKTTEGGCEQPFSITLSDGQSFSGPPVEDYCGINTDLATCEAVRALLENQRCNGGDDEECPQPSGLCRDVGSLLNRCTYPCSGDAQCDNPPNPGSSCGASGSGNTDYCGG